MKDAKYSTPVSMFSLLFFTLNLMKTKTEVFFNPSIFRHEYFGLRSGFREEN